MDLVTALVVLLIIIALLGGWGWSAGLFEPRPYYGIGGLGAVVLIVLVLMVLRAMRLL